MGLRKGKEIEEGMIDENEGGIGKVGERGQEGRILQSMEYVLGKQE